MLLITMAMKSLVTTMQTFNPITVKDVEWSARLEDLSVLITAQHEVKQGTAENHGKFLKVIKVLNYFDCGPSEGNKPSIESGVRRVQAEIVHLMNQTLQASMEGE